MSDLFIKQQKESERETNINSIEHTTEWEQQEGQGRASTDEDLMIQLEEKWKDVSWGIVLMVSGDEWTLH